MLVLSVNRWFHIELKSVLTFHNLFFNSEEVQSGLPALGSLHESGCLLGGNVLARCDDSISGLSLEDWSLRILSIWWCRMRSYLVQLPNVKSSEEI
jgi:hypothetical protein